MKNGTLFHLPYVGRLVAFCVIGDFLNFNMIYPETREICEVLAKLKRKAEAEEIKQHGHPD